MSDFKLNDLIESTGATLLRGRGDETLNGVSTDTRTLRGDQLFLALDGPNFDGNRFAQDALKRGAGCLLLRSDDPRPALIEDLPGDTPIVVHESPRRALSELAAWHRRRLDIPVIGITGSCGKTTTKNILSELLTDHRSVVSSPASFNNEIGVPHTLLLADSTTEALIVEMGTNSPGEIRTLCETARPSAGIITNVGAAHLEGLGSVEGVAREKGDLASSLPSDGFCVLNDDCRWTRVLSTLTEARVITFSVDGRGDLNATDVWFHPGGTTFRLNDEHEVTSPLLGLHTVQNLLAALSAVVGLGIELRDVLPAVSRLKGERRRMERIEAGGFTIFDDSYNANPDSARASVRVLAGLHGHGRRVLVLADMLELGEFAAEMHHEVGRLATEAGIDLLILLGDLTRATAAGALEAGMKPDQVIHIADVDEGLTQVPGLVREGDVVLIKGSRAMGLDRLVGRLTDLG
ncbi:MAG: UDP-N-acetylmuramoyl-tripeptide--D-alanyl-D-alanine ligase [Chlamydiales bacterium]|jgi:UDP-N-acetylmuramoyl-tripeptide--D-alanyl-D-alanine ligase